MHCGDRCKIAASFVECKVGELGTARAAVAVRWESASVQRAAISSAVSGDMIAFRVHNTESKKEYSQGSSTFRHEMPGKRPLRARLDLP